MVVRSWRHFIGTGSRQRKHPQLLDCFGKSEVCMLRRLTSAMASSLVMIISASLLLFRFRGWLLLGAHEINATIQRQ